jgi:purine catabolism regulator
MLTVASLVADCELSLTVEADAERRPVRWVHISELEDPTKWLSGGELRLTTRIQLADEDDQRRFVELLAESGSAGLGLGTGFEHSELPPAVIEEAEARGLPLFEVPYEMPFIAITERAAALLVSEQYGLLERVGSMQHGLERLVIEGRGLEEILAPIATAIGGTAIAHESSGREIVHSPDDADLSGELLGALADEIRERDDSAGPFEPAGEELAGRALAVPVPGRRGVSAAAWLTVIGDSELGEFERLACRQAAIVVGLELMRERAVRETERRLAGDLLGDALGGRLDDAATRLRPFGLSGEAAVLVFELDDPPSAEGALEAFLAEAGAAGLVGTGAGGGRELLCAVIDAGSDPEGSDPAEIAARAREALAAAGPVRAAVSRPAPLSSLRRAFHEARCALEATSLANGGAPDVASHDDLGAFTLLLALQDDDALRAYSNGLLDPIERTDGEYGGELLRSLEAYIENNGNWERAARSLPCHRHTLRYRIRKVEELTGRDLARATDRIELWLALRARELVR